MSRNSFLKKCPDVSKDVNRDGPFRKIFESGECINMVCKIYIPYFFLT